EVKPRSADDTWIKPGKVGSRHNTITKTISKGWSFLRLSVTMAVPGINGPRVFCKILQKYFAEYFGANSLFLYL
ncbi:hypothetical protein, partial [Dyadobacter sp.]|uniref:hypothetical protein n=1 Tax=Dyadobacter sp. TaxID=1914288 RepID=UPI003F712C48